MESWLASLLPRLHQGQRREFHRKLVSIMASLAASLRAEFGCFTYGTVHADQLILEEIVRSSARIVFAFVRCYVFSFVWKFQQEEYVSTLIMIRSSLDARNREGPVSVILSRF